MIRARSMRFLKRKDEGDDIFAPLEGKDDLLKKLIAEQHAIASRAKPRASAIIEAKHRATAITETKHHSATTTRAEPPVATIIDDSPKRVSVPAHTFYNAAVVERIASAKVAARMPKSALKFCRDALKAWYADAAETMAGHFGDEGSNVADIGPLRDGIANLWRVYAQLVSNVLKESRNATQGQEEVSKLEVTVMDMATSCPLVGAHHIVIQARLNLEYGDCDFLQSMDSSTLKGFSQAIKNVDVQEDKLLEILSSSIAMCNDAVQLSPGDRA